MGINTLLDFTEELLNMPGSFFAQTLKFATRKTARMQSIRARKGIAFLYEPGKKHAIGIIFEEVTFV